MITPKFSLGLPEDARAIRQKVFVEEQGYQHEFVNDDDGCWCLVLYFNNLPIATGRIKEVDPETYRVGRVAVLSEFRGKKVGTYVMKFLETKIRTLGGHHVILGAQADKVDFYRKAGYSLIEEEPVFYDEGHPHVMMQKELKKRKYNPRWSD